MVVPPCAIGTKVEPLCGRERSGSPQGKSRAGARDQALEPLCGRDAAAAAGSPAEPVLSLSKDEIPIPPSGRGTCRPMRPFFAFNLRLVARGLLLFFPPRFWRTWEPGKLE